MSRNPNLKVLVDIEKSLRLRGAVCTLNPSIKQSGGPFDVCFCASV